MEFIRLKLIHAFLSDEDIDDLYYNLYTKFT